MAMRRRNGQNTAPARAPARALPTAPSPAPAPARRPAAAAAALLFALLSALSRWSFYKQYEPSWRATAYNMGGGLAITAAVALALVLSPSGRSLRPGGAPVDQKNACVGAGVLALAFFLAGGVVGPLSVSAFASLAAAAFWLL